MMQLLPLIKKYICIHACIVSIVALLISCCSIPYITFNFQGPIYGASSSNTDA